MAHVPVVEERAMSLGGNFDKYEGNSRYERYLIQG